MIHLRTLTEKSNIDFHWTGGILVGTLLEKKPLDLIKIYYTYEKINFMPSVLDKLRESFPNFYEIKKPGIDPNWRIILFSKYGDVENMTDEKIKNIFLHYKINKKPVPEIIGIEFSRRKSIRKIKTFDQTDEIYTKSSLRSFNHKN